MSFYHISLPMKRSLGLLVPIHQPLLAFEPRKTWVSSFLVSKGYKGRGILLVNFV
jgi:hypothetical protein